MSAEPVISPEILEQAKKLLIYPDLTLTEIANRVGFNSIHYFSHKFKKMRGRVR